MTISFRNLPDGVFKMHSQSPNQNLVARTYIFIRIGFQIVGVFETLVRKNFTYVIGKRTEQSIHQNQKKNLILFHVISYMCKAEAQEPCFF